MLNLNYAPKIYRSTAGMSVAEWEQARRDSIGGSDMATILGMSPYGNTKLDLYNTKLGVKPVKGITPTQEVIFNAGHFLENLVAQLFSYRTGYLSYEVKAMFEHPHYPYLRANIDRFYRRAGDNNPIAFLECKTSSEFNRPEWGKDDESAAPSQYIIQTAQYMSVLNIDKCKIACLFINEGLRWVAGILYQMKFIFEKFPKSVLADMNDMIASLHDDSVQAMKPLLLSLMQGEMLIPQKYIADCSDAIGNNFVIRTLKRNLQFEEYMINEAGNFWNNHVLKRLPPSLAGENPEAALATLEKYYPPRKVSAPIILTSKTDLGDAAKELAELKEKKAKLAAEGRTVEKQIARASIPFIEALGGANRGEFVDSSGKSHMVSYEGKSRISVPSAKLPKLKEEHPDVYDKYVQETQTKPSLKIK